MLLRNDRVSEPTKRYATVLHFSFRSRQTRDNDARGEGHAVAHVNRVPELARRHPITRRMGEPDGCSSARQVSGPHPRLKRVPTFFTTFIPMVWSCAAHISVTPVNNYLPNSVSLRRPKPSLFARQRSHRGFIDAEYDS